MIVPPYLRVAKVHKHRDCFGMRSTAAMFPHGNRHREGRFGCHVILVDDNLAHNRESGSSPGTLQIFGYCNWNFIAYGVYATRHAYNLNHPAIAAATAVMIFACAPIGYYGPYHVCSSGTQGVPPVLKHAERDDVEYRMFYYNPFFPELSNAEIGTYYINDEGVFYPKIAIAPSQATQPVFAHGSGFVPFPKGETFERCIGDAAPPPCLTPNERSDFREILLHVLPPQPVDYAAHHIDPRSWCGQNDLTNGVFLPSTEHDQYTNRWLPAHFHPDDPVQICRPLT